MLNYLTELAPVLSILLGVLIPLKYGILFYRWSVFLSMWDISPRTLNEAASTLSNFSFEGFHCTVNLKHPLPGPHTLAQHAPPPRLQPTSTLLLLCGTGNPSSDKCCNQLVPHGLHMLIYNCISNISIKDNQGVILTYKQDDLTVSDISSRGS